MKLLSSSTSTLGITLLSVLTLALPTTVIAAPASEGDSKATDPCRTCLAQELQKIPKCDRLTPTTPAPPTTEQGPVKIQEYKSTYPDVVECLCLAAQWTEEPKDWIAKCDKVCMAAVAKNQKKVLKAIEAQLSCKSQAFSGSGSEAPAPASVAPVAAAKHKASDKGAYSAGAVSPPYPPSSAPEQGSSTTGATSAPPSSHASAARKATGPGSSPAQEAKPAGSADTESTDTNRASTSASNKPAAE
ncbi:hypothetical protein BGX33_009680 [Mortierella sp. NVP41]|nr:hypothetical protein BGX33_009680 [Mortierella sp. NVP41]